jgi:hypothetical protein
VNPTGPRESSRTKEKRTHYRIRRQSWRHQALQGISHDPRCARASGGREMSYSDKKAAVTKSTRFGSPHPGIQGSTQPQRPLRPLTWSNNPALETTKWNLCTPRTRYPHILRQHRLLQQGSPTLMLKAPGPQRPQRRLRQQGSPTLMLKDPGPQRPS